MDTKSLTAIGVVGLLLVAGVGITLADTGGTPSAENATITVSADATVERTPDRATVTVAAVGQGETATAARDDLSGDAADVEQALEGEGATVTTSRFRVSPEYDYSGEGREQVGYVAIHTVEAETSDVGAVGTLVDTAVDAGVDRVRGITYSLSEGTRSDAREEALTTAMERARGDAQTLATAEDRTVGDALTVETSDSGRRVVRAEAAEAGGGTDISPGPVTVDSSVRVTYELD